MLPLGFFERLLVLGREEALELFDPVGVVGDGLFRFSIMPIFKSTLDSIFFRQPAPRSGKLTTQPLDEQ